VVRIEQRILSPTAINTYLSCPRKFYLRYVKRQAFKPSIHLIRGLIVHDTLYQFHRNNPEISQQTPIGEVRRRLLEIFNRMWEKAMPRIASLGLSEEEIRYYHDDSELMLFNYSHWFYKHHMPTPELSEARILSKNLMLMGVIDALLPDGDGVALVDYKTSKNIEITSDMERQAAFYALLYQDKYKIAPDKVLVHFLKTPEEPLVIHIDEQLLEYGRIVLQSIREKTISQDEKDYPCTCGGYCEEEFMRGNYGNG